MTAHEEAVRPQRRAGTFTLGIVLVAAGGLSDFFDGLRPREFIQGGSDL